MVSVRREFDSRSQIHSGVVQLAERGTRNAVTGVRFSAPDPRAWSSGRASAFQAEDVSSTLTVRSSFPRSSFSGRISRCHREDTGSNPVDRSSFGGASSMGELWSCKPAMRVRFPRIPPNYVGAGRAAQAAACGAVQTGSTPVRQPKVCSAPTSFNWMRISPSEGEDRGSNPHQGSLTSEYFLGDKGR